MRKLPYLIFLSLFSVFHFAQVLEPVKWATETVKISDSEYELISIATINKGWHLYSQKVPEGGPIPTTFNYSKNAAYSLIGKTAEEKGHTVDDPFFNMQITYFDTKATFSQRIRLKSATKMIKAMVEFMVCDDTRCLPPNEVALSFNLSQAKEADASVSTPPTKGTNPALWWLFTIAFLSGFTALLTPCVFPMIPLTVSFFIKQSKSRGFLNAVVFGISIVVIYVLLGSVITAIFGADSLNQLATSVWFNIAFFLLLFIFGLSFLGAFEISLPQSWANKIDAQSNRQGVIGIFFMALALAVVSFSCTGPIVGTLLVEAANRGGAAPVIGMLGFSLAIALPFTLFAAFPSWMKSLPKSGGWLNVVKVVLGFLELAFAFKFLSQADLVLQAHWLSREVFIAIWIAIFGVLALYLFGRIRLAHDALSEGISAVRLTLGMLALSFTIYLIPGLWGAPLKLISAFPPPLHYSESPYGVGYAKQSLSRSVEKKLPKGGHLLEPFDILTFNDFKQGLDYAKQVNKPVLIDFTGWACVNCRKMEQNVWSNPKVLDILKEQVVLVSLYVDDRRKISKDKIKESELQPGKMLNTVGKIWTEFQIKHYRSNTQPLYVLMNHQQKNLIPPIGYTPNIDTFFNWLITGIHNFNQEK